MIVTASLLATGTMYRVIPRVPAQSLEDAVFVAVRDQIKATRDNVKVPLRTVEGEDRDAVFTSAVDRVVVGPDCLRVTLTSIDPSDSADGETQDALGPEEEKRTLEIPFSLQRRAGSFQILPSSTGGRVVSMRDPALIKAVVRGKQWAERLLSGAVVAGSFVNRQFAENEVAERTVFLLTGIRTRGNAPLLLYPCRLTFSVIPSVA